MRKKGSLLDKLRKAGLALELSAYSSESEVEVGIALTERGHKDYQEVLRYVFAYISFLQEKGYLKTYFEDLSARGKIAYDNIEAASSGGIASSYSAARLLYKTGDYLRSKYILSNYSPEHFQRVIKTMTADNLSSNIKVVLMSSSEKPVLRMICMM